MFYTKLIVTVLLAVVGWGAKDPVLRNGIWRASLQRQDGQQIIFNFETRDSAGRKVLYIMNAEERLLVDSIKMAGDSVFIQMPFFESGFKAKLDKAGNLEGYWITRLADKEQKMPFKAVYNRKQRFPAPVPAQFDISGRWSVTFIRQKGKPLQALGEFKQTGTHLSGTFITPSGDYRFLEGVVAGNRLHLSTFDGSNAYLFTANITDDHAISDGYFYSGPVGADQWKANKDSAAALPDTYKHTIMKPGESRLNFKFTSIDDKIVSIQDEQFKGKVVVIQLLGSWCPNCMDETRFLSDYYNRNRQKGIEMIGLGYERSTDFQRSKKSIQSFRQRFNVQYPLLVTGVTASDSLLTEKTLPQLDKIKAFPTTIFIDRNGIVRKIHNGFTGPGSIERYKLLTQIFDKTINDLLNESYNPVVK